MMTTHPLLARILTGLGLVPVLLSGCSDSATEVRSTKQISESTIVNQLSSELGVDNLSAQCPEVVSPELGATFLCLATTDDDSVIDVEATVLPDGRVQMKTTNVIRANMLDRFEEKAIQDLNGAAGSRLVESDLECGDKPIILTTANQMICTVNNNGAFHDLTFTINDIDQLLFDLEVARIPQA